MAGNTHRKYHTESTTCYLTSGTIYLVSSHLNLYMYFVSSGLTWEEEHGNPSDPGTRGDCSGLSFKDRGELPLLHRAMMGPDPLWSVRLPWHSASFPAPETLRCLIVFAARDTAGGNY